MATIKTSREFYNAILANENIAEEIRTYAKDELDKLDARNEHRRTAVTPKKKENEELMAKILELDLKDTMASEVGKALDISTSKASALLGKLADEGKVTVAVVKSGKGKVNGYTKVTE